MGPSNGLNNSKLQLATAIAENVLSGKTFYAGDKSLKTGSMPNMSNPGGLVDGSVRVSIATIIGYGNYDTGVATDPWVPVIVIKPNKGYYDGGGNANIAIDSRLIRGNIVHVETGSQQWDLGRNPWTKTFSGEIFAAGVTFADEDGGTISVSWSGNTMTVNNQYSDDTPVTFKWICAHY